MPNPPTSPQTTEQIEAKERLVHYVLSSHWDREWYRTFQDFRRRLVHLLDRVLDDLASGKLRGPFTTDGQSVVLDDYLEIRPERRAELEAHVRAGRIIVGPWFVLPDECLVSGEALIRNLRLGIETARTYGGEPSRVGFVCDLFGHIGQLPQILRGFSIEAALVWRGLAPRESAHFRWRGSDGSELLAYRFGRTGYCDYAFDVRRAHQPEHLFDQQQAASDLATYLAKEADRSSVPPLLVFDGADHLEHDPRHYSTLWQRGPSPEFPYRIQHSTLDAYVAEVSLHADAVRDLVEGELRETAHLPCVDDQQALIPGVLSSRVWIKQENALCQSLLCQWAEPCALAASAWASAASCSAYMRVAWRWLLLNQAHDSIGGCSIDEVHEDMRHRFAQCRRIAEGQIEESLGKIAGSLGIIPEPNTFLLLVLNPVAQPRDEVVELCLEIPGEWGEFQEFFGYEPKPAFRLFLAGSECEIPYQLLTLAPSRTRLQPNTLRFPDAPRVTPVRVACRLALPALGFTTVSVRQGERSRPDPIWPPTPLPTRHPSFPGFATSDRSMANGHLKVEFASNGTLTLTDQRTGARYLDLLTLEDVADLGDGWYHGPAVNDVRLTSAGSASEIALLHDGPELCAFEITVRFLVPATFDFQNHRRSEERSTLVCRHKVILRRDSEFLEIATNLDNTARDHRVRLLFPTGLRTEHFLTDGNFDVVSRSVGLPKDNHLRRELDVETVPQHSWTALSDGQCGFAVVAPGLLETCVRDLPERPIALTLFRSTGRTVFTNGQPAGQLLGPLSFGYALRPFAGAVPRGALGVLAQKISGGLRTTSLFPRSVEETSFQENRLPPSAGLLELRGSGLVTSLREVDGAVEIRLFNPEETRIEARFVVGEPFGTPLWVQAQPVDFESRAIGAMFKLRDGISLGPKQIMTLRLS